MYLHGTGANFYSGPVRFLPDSLRDSPVVHLSFNLRSHDLGYTIPEAERSEATFSARGAIWERPAESGNDIRAALDAAGEWGTERAVLVGHSSGGFHAPLYLARSPDRRVAALVLLSPLMSLRTSFSEWFATTGDEERALDAAALAVASGDGERVLPMPGWFYAVSAHTLLERAAHPESAWQEAFRKLQIPTLVLWGDQESRAEQWAAACREHPGAADGLVRGEAVAGSEHSYHGCEDAVATLVSDFIEQVSR